MCLPLSLSLSSIDGLVQIITSVKSSLDRPRFGVEGGRGQNHEHGNRYDRIFDASGEKYSSASQWLYNDIHLPLSWMDGLIQTTTGVKSGLDGQRYWGLGDRGKSIESTIAARSYLTTQTMV